MKKSSIVSITILFLIALAIVASPEAGAITISGFFTDDNGSTFEGDIDAIADAGITKGCNPPADTHYCPDRSVTRGQMAAFLRRALDLPSPNKDFFIDDNSSIFEGDINAIAEAGITKGCNPPDNTRFCPTDEVDRGQMAAFLRRSNDLPSSNTDYFADDDFSTFEDDINAIADAGITKGCNPPDNTFYCPSRDVTRGEMAAFLRRALDLPPVILTIPIDGSTAMRCSKDGETCTLTVDLTAGRTYRVWEGVFLVDPATSGEEAEFNSGNTTFTLTANGSSVALTARSPHTEGGVTTRYWTRQVGFEPGTHILVAQWRWDGQLIKTSKITIRASG